DVPGVTFTAAKAINDSGVIAGDYVTADGHLHGFVRDAAGNFTSIDFPDSIRTTVTALNDSGQVAGWYEDSAGGQHGFIATPVPEPRRSALRLAAALPLLLSRWRRPPRAGRVNFSGRPDGSILQTADHEAVHAAYSPRQPRSRQPPRGPFGGRIA